MFGQNLKIEWFFDKIRNSFPEMDIESISGKQGICLRIISFNYCEQKRYYKE